MAKGRAGVRKHRDSAAAGELSPSPGPALLSSHGKPGGEEIPHSVRNLPIHRPVLLTVLS